MKRFNVVVPKDSGGREASPMKKWLREHPEHIPTGLDLKSSTSHQLRNGLKKLGWLVEDAPTETRLVMPGVDVSGRINANSGTKGEVELTGYNTNLAAEFYVLSMLYRLGAEANLTLGNKKSVDIVVVHDAGDAITIDVKGLAGKTSWPVDNFRPRKRHFLVLVCFLGQISDPRVVPEVYVVPSDNVAPLTYNSPKGRKVVQLSKVRRDGNSFRDAWKQLL